MGKFKNVGIHAEDLADGRMLAPGEYVELDEEATENPFNAAKIADGVLMDVGDTATEPTATEAATLLAAESGVELSTISGSGADGQIIKSDVERHLAEQGGDES